MDGQQLDFIRLTNDALNIEDKIRKNLPEGVAADLDTSGVIGIRMIEKIIESAGATELENIHIEHSRLNVELTRAEYELEKSSHRRYLTFIEAAYDTEDREEFEKAFSIEFGISIPVVNPDRLDINRRKLNALKAQREYLSLKKEVTEQIAVLSREIKRLIAQHNALTAKKEDNLTHSSFDIYRRLDGVSPLILLKLKESQLKTEIALQEIIHQLYETYIEFLAVSGKLSEKPLKNYLSDNLEPIRP